MVNRPRAKGTAAETAFLRYSMAQGFPDAHRNALAGGFDIGDVTLCGRPKAIAEVKADRSLDYSRFLREAEAERVNAKAAVGFVVIKPEGIGDRRMHAWWALLSSGTYDALGEIAGSANFMASFMDASEAVDPDGKRQRKFRPGTLLAERAELLRGMPGTRLKPGVSRASRTGWGFRFLYLPDALELLRWAGFGEPMRPVPPEGRGFPTPGIQGFQADRVWYDEIVTDETATFTREKWDN